MTACCIDEMDKTVAILVLTLAFVFVVADQVYHFTKLHDGNNAFNYTLEKPNGEISTGQTIFIHKMFHETVRATRYYHFIIDEDNAVHWIAFSDSEFNSTSTLSRTIHPVERDDNNLAFNDNTYEFEIRINENEGILRVNLITVLWDFDNVCLSKINDNRNLFRFEIKATNVPRIVNGETYYEANQTDPLIQRIIVPDVPTNYIVEIELTEQEFNTWNTFCRKITKLVEIPLVVRNFGEIYNIDPNALKSLIG